MSEHMQELDQQAQGLTEDETLAYTQDLRQRLVKQMTRDGQAMPSDPKEQYALLTALKDMDSQALGIKKIGAKERTGNADRLVQQALVALLGRMGSTSPFEAKEPIEGTAVRVAPELDTRDLPELTLAPGETDTGIATEGYAEFMARMESPKT